jgi:hypothetical protein
MIGMVFQVSLATTLYIFWRKLLACPTWKHVNACGCDVHVDVDGWVDMDMGMDVDVDVLHACVARFEAIGCESTS